MILESLQFQRVYEEVRDGKEKENDINIPTLWASTDPSFLFHGRHPTQKASADKEPRVGLHEVWANDEMFIWYGVWLGPLIR